MTGWSLLSPRVAKEMRGLAPAWLACVVTIVAAAAAADGRNQMWGVAAYFLGAVTLGALSIGQEYSARTLTWFLSQPASRGRLFLDKLYVLAPMVLTLSAIVWILLFNPAQRWLLGTRWPQAWWTFAFVLPLLCGLFIAPWLTMVCRNPLAGIVFTIAMPGMLLTAGEIAADVQYGIGPASRLQEASDLKFAILWIGTLAISTIAALASWRLFMRLEAIDGRGSELHLPWFRSRMSDAAATPAFSARRPVWLLVKKELRLQQLTFVVSGLYLLTWISIVALRSWYPDSNMEGLLDGGTLLYCGAIAALAGSLASAEERQLGTIEWQVLLPMAAWKQWSIKTGVAVTLALLLGLALPALLFYVLPYTQIRSALDLRTALVPAYVVALLTVACLYVSSLNTSGLRALIVSVPAVFGGMVFVTGWVVWVHAALFARWTMQDLVFNDYRQLLPSAIIWSRLLIALLVVISAGALGLLLRFGLSNHRSAERGARRISRQLLALGAFLVISFAIWTTVFWFYRNEVMSEFARQYPLLLNPRTRLP